MQTPKGTIRVGAFLEIGENRCEPDLWVRGFGLELAPSDRQHPLMNPLLRRNADFDDFHFDLKPLPKAQAV